MATTMPKSTPSSSLMQASSQATAPVYEYRCMFTHDLLKKKKKWHDGVAKYHTFNKRVMVYDENRNLIGDLHYRGPEEFDEGLELKLDKPVLVEVGDRIGETSTDLTPLFGRQKQDGDAIHQGVQQHRPTMPRISALHSGLKPKSIKELLSTSQGPARSTMLMRSPYEQRQALAEIRPDIEPPSKRRKIDVVTARPQSTAVVTHPGRGNVSTKAKKLPELPREVIDLSSEDEAHATTAVWHTKEHTPSRDTARPGNQEQTARRLKSSRSKRSTETRTESSRAANSVVPSRQLTVSPSSVASRPRVASHSSSKPLTSSGLTSSLKFNTQPSRSRLMYKALLAVPVVTDLPSKPLEYDSSLSNFQRSAIPRSRRTDLLDLDQAMANSEIPSLPTQAGGAIAELANEFSVVEAPSVIQSDIDSNHVTTEDEATGPDEESRQHISEMFLTQASSQQPLPDSVMFGQDELDSIATWNGNKSSRVAVREDSQSVADSPELDAEARQDLPSSPVFVFRVPSPEPADICGLSKLAHTSHITVPLPERSFEQLAAKAGQLTPSREKSQLGSVCSMPAESQDKLFRRPRPYRRVISEPVQEAESAIDPIANISSRRQVPARRQPSLLVQPPALRQTASDPLEVAAASIELSSPDLEPQIMARQGSVKAAAAATNPEHVNERSTTETVPKESGPWTATEAFLLFDRWPPGKQKPVYATTAERSSVALRDVIPITNGCMTVRAMSKKYGTFGSAKLVSQR